MKFNPSKSLDELEGEFRIAAFHVDEKGKTCPATGKSPLSNQLHLIAEPVNVKWKTQNVWIGISETEGSAFHQWVTALLEKKIIAEKDVEKARDATELARIMLSILL